MGPGWREESRGDGPKSSSLLLLLLLSVLSQKHLDSMRSGLPLFYYLLLLILKLPGDLIWFLRDPTRSSNFFFSLSQLKENWSGAGIPGKYLGIFHKQKKEIYLKKKSSSSVQDGRGSAGVILGWSGGGLQRGGGVFQGWSLGAEVGAKCGWLATLHREPWTAAAGLGTSCWSPYRSIPCWTVCPTRRWRSWFWGRATSGKPVRDVWRIYNAGKWNLMSCRD